MNTLLNFRLYYQNETTPFRVTFITNSPNVTDKFVCRQYVINDARLWASD